MLPGAPCRSSRRSCGKHCPAESTAAAARVILNVWASFLLPVAPGGVKDLPPSSLSPGSLPFRAHLAHPGAAGSGTGAEIHRGGSMPGGHPPLRRHDTSRYCGPGPMATPRRHQPDGLPRLDREHGVPGYGGCALLAGRSSRYSVRTRSSAKRPHTVRGSSRARRGSSRARLARIAARAKTAPDRRGLSAGRGRGRTGRRARR